MLPKSECVPILSTSWLSICSIGTLQVRGFASGVRLVDATLRSVQDGPRIMQEPQLIIHRGVTFC